MINNLQYKKTHRTINRIENNKIQIIKVFSYIAIIPII